MALIWAQPDGWFFAGLAALCALLAVHFAAFFRAQAPRRRTLPETGSFFIFLRYHSRFSLFFTAYTVMK